MTHLRAIGARVPVIGALGVAGVIGIVKARGKRKRRPTGDQLRRMSDADFSAFIRASGIKTVTTAGIAVSDGPAD